MEISHHPRDANFSGNYFKVGIPRSDQVTSIYQTPCGKPVIKIQSFRNFIAKKNEVDKVDTSNQKKLEAKLAG